MVTSVANSIHTMLVTPQNVNYNCSVRVAYFTLVCVEEDIDTTPALQLQLVVGRVTNMA